MWSVGPRDPALVVELVMLDQGAKEEGGGGVLPQGLTSFTVLPSGGGRGVRIGRLAPRL